MHRMAASAFVLGIVLATTAVYADDETPPVTGGRTYVQHQIELIKHRHPQVASIIVSGTRDGDKAPVILGSTHSTADVLRVAPSAKPDGTSATGGRATVREAFLSSTKHRLGTIEVGCASSVTDAASCEKMAAAIQSDLARNTLSAKNAADPYPFDPAWGPDTYAQQLTTKTIGRHPDLLVMMIHATPPGGAHNIIIGSNIGRFGKIADEDDLRVIEKGSTNLEIGGEKDRFETELPLNDASGKRIGALGLVFPYKASDDKEAIHRHGLAIRDEIAAAIPNSAALFRKAN